MKALVTLSILVMFAGVANAQTAPLPTAGELGLPETQTGYKYVIDINDKAKRCESDTVVVSTEKHMPDWYRFMTKCDGSRIGWVTRTLYHFDLNDRDGFYGPNEYLELVYPASNGQEIVIYPCGSERDQEFGPNDVKPPREKQEIYDLIMAAKRARKNIKVDLWYNEFILSGKCIGKVTVL